MVQWWRICQCLTMKEMQEMWVWSLGLEDSPGIGNGNPLQYSCLGNLMEIEALQFMESQRAGHDWTTEHTHTQSLNMHHLMGINSCLLSSWSTPSFGSSFTKIRWGPALLVQMPGLRSVGGWAAGVGGVLFLRSDMGRTKIRSQVFWLKVSAASTPGCWQCCVV